MRLANRLQSVYPVGILLPGWMSTCVLKERLHKNSLDLHNLAKTTLPDNFQELKVLDLERPGNVELVLGVASGPDRILRSSGNCIDEDLLLVKVHERVRQMFGRVSAVDGRSCINSARRGLWAARGRKGAGQCSLVA